MKIIKNWNDENIKVIISKGNKIATYNPYDNLIYNNKEIFPKSEIIQKIYKSNQEKAFINEKEKSTMDYYSDIQSINSEDAITWSIFGTLIYSPISSQIEFTKELFKSINIDSYLDDVNIWLWRRIPHPDTLVSGGPEIDFGIQTNSTLLLGEAKWLSSVGKNQGKEKNKDQIDLRIEFIEKYATKLYPSIKEFIILGVSLDKSIINRTHNYIKLINLSWDELSEIKSHPFYEEIKKYINWKKKISIDKLL